MTTINGPSQKLEECYQNELRTLLKLKSNQPELSEDGLSIPQSAVSTQNTLMDKRLLLKELDYQIKQEKQKQELLLVQKVFKGNLSSIPLPGSCSSCRMQNWYHEMYLYDKTWNGSYSDARYFFDLKHDTNSLSFGSRYQGICLRIFIKRSILSKPTKEFSIESSLAVEGLDLGVEYLTSGKPAKLFVEEVLHSGLTIL